MRIVFRVDASLAIGGGHVMRCLALAEALSASGARCDFICRELPGHMLNVIRLRGHGVMALPYVPQDTDQDTSWQTDASQTCGALGPDQVDWLIVDHYFLDRRWEEQVKPHYRRLMVIDDLINRPHVCSLLLDQNLHAEAAQRYRRFVPSSCTLRLGPAHAVLNSAFDVPPVRIRDGSIENVLVYFGSNDTHNLASHAMSALEKFDFLTVNIVLGPEHPYRTSIHSRAGQIAHIKVVDVCKSMADLMNEADLALGVCGIAAWERCAMGLPTLISITAENQREDALGMHACGAAFLLGEAADLDESSWTKALTQHLAEPELVCRMSQAASSLVAGHAENRAELIEMLLSNDF